MPYSRVSHPFQNILCSVVISIERESTLARHPTACKRERFKYAPSPRTGFEPLCRIYPIHHAVTREVRDKAAAPAARHIQDITARVIRVRMSWMFCMSLG